MTALVIIEHDNNNIKSSSYNALAAAACLKQEIEVIVIGYHCANIAELIAKVKVISKVHLLDHENYAHPLAERWSEAVLQLLDSSYRYVIAPATTFGKNLLPRIAVKLGVAQLSDVIEVVNTNTFKRPIYAGNAIVTVRTPSDQPVCLTIRTTAFPPLVADADTSAVIIPNAFVSQNQQSQFIGTELHQTNRPELGSASIVVSGGRGLQNKAMFQRLIQIADRLGAAIGASRAAVDSGLAPNDYQIGQTGQIVAPKLYFAIGISGAIQHLAGMKDSKIIVAINKDPDAPIFQVANYGLVADLNEVLSEWEMTLTEMGY